MIDAILHLPAETQLPAHLTDDNGNPALSEPQSHNAGGDRLHYVRLNADQLDEWRPYATVLSEAPYTGTGTAQRVYQQLQGDPAAWALYTSVYDTSPREIVRNWLDKAGVWERHNPQFVAFVEKLGLTTEQADDYMRQAAML